jgi:hypothetical protein
MTNATLVLDEQNARPRSNSATSIYSNNRPDITDDASVSVAKSVADLAAKALVDVVVYAGSKIWLGAKSLFGFGQKVKKSDDLQDGVNRDDVSTEDLYEFQLNNSADQNERILTGENVENNTAGAGA